MFKKTLLAAAMIAASTNAMATTTVSAAGKVTYATELFGTTDVLNTATIVLTIGAAVQAGATATFTYELNDGEFAADPTLVYAGAGSVGIAKASGGAGSNSIVFTVAVSTALAGTETFTLSMVSIQNMTGMGTDGATITVTPEVDNTNLVATPFVETITGVGTAANITVAESDPGVDVVAVADSSQIMVTDQKKFAGSALGAPLYDSVTFTESNKEEDGSTAFALVADDAVTITVSGTVPANSEICIVPENDVNCDNEVGSNTTTTSGATLTLTGTEAAGLTTQDIILVVDGNSDISVGDFTISTSITFDESTYNTTTYSSTVESELTLAGLTALDDSTRIPIITKPSASDETFVRVTNTGNTTSAVYAAITLQDGTSYFGELGDVEAGKTEVFESQDFADAAGITTWSGRANALLSATTGTQDDLLVVPLVRANDTLTNQSGFLQNP